MIIVSQDKEKIINFDNIKTIELDRETGFKSIIIFRETSEVETGVCGLFIGHYATRERAKEVLQGIINAYEKAGNIAFETSEDERLMRLTHNSSVFEMPGK